MFTSAPNPQYSSAPSGKMTKYAPSKALGGVYYHDDLNSRPSTKEDADKIAMNWPDEIGGVAAWRAQEPINCQAHLQVCNVTRN